jgi:hypothetical protein
MGGFDVQQAQPAQATQYYKSGSGLHFGGACTAEGACPAKGQNIAHCVGDRVKGNPYVLATEDQEPKCPACQGKFRPGWMWFANCNLSLTNSEGATERAAIRGGDLRSSILDWNSYAGRYVELEVTPL